MKQLKVAGYIINFDVPDFFIGKYVLLFEYSGDRKADVSISLSNEKKLKLPPDAVLETNAPMHTIYHSGDARYYVRADNGGVTYCKYDKACSEFVINVNGDFDPYAPHLLKDEDQVSMRVGVMAVIRRIFIMIIAARGGICVHSASLGHNGEAVVFSAKSGTGKTTHTNQWREVFPGTEMINGDNGYCFASESGAVIHGAPWCGTSEQCRNVSVPVKAFVFLEQAPENSIRKLSAPEAFMRLSAGCFLPAWDKELMLQAIATAEKIATGVACYHLKCLPDHDAARVAERGIWEV
jgi:hypothetical protein